MTSSSDTLSARETADALGLSERTIRKWIHEGRLQAVRRGRAYAVSLEEAAALAQQSSRKTRLPSERDEMAELRGRYLELAAQVARLQQLLTEEQRRAAALEAKLEAA